MILYTLTNRSFTLDVYEDKVVFHPRLLKGLVSRKWSQSLTIPYAQLQRVELHKKFWPVGHQLCFHTAERSVVFRFRGLLPFFERLHVYLERQTIRYYNHPTGLPRPSKSVPDLVAERRARNARSDLAA